MNARTPVDLVNYLPLLLQRDLHAPLAWRNGAAISAHQYLEDVAAQAAILPPAGSMVNLCADRYCFSVSLGAALVRGHSSVMPPDARIDTLARLCPEGANTYLMVDSPLAVPSGVFVVRSVVDGFAPFGQTNCTSDAGSSAGALAAISALPAITANQHAVSLLTSGSTGVPQVHAKSWATLSNNIAVAANRLATLLGQPSLHGLTVVATVPPQHSYGLESSVLLPLLGGAAFDCSNIFYPADIAAALASVPRPRCLVTTPFHLKTLLQSGVELPPVDLLVSATSPLSPQLAVQAEARFGGLMVEIYGCTETGQVATRCTTHSEWWEVLGDLRIHAEPHAADDAVASEKFVVQGGYVTEPTPLADVLDLASPRTFRLLGRSNDLIHVAGKRSSLGHLDFHLNSIAGVDDGAFWLPDDVADGVVRPVAFVVASGLTASAIIAALRHRLESIFVPRRIVHVAALPREATGKLTARAMRELAAVCLYADVSSTVRQA